MIRFETNPMRTHQQKGAETELMQSVLREKLDREGRRRYIRPTLAADL